MSEALPASNGDPNGGCKRIAVVGAGMAGMAAAYELSKQGQEVVLFEASARLGGTVETVHHGGFISETGPDSWVSDKSAARDLATELGLADEIIYSNDAVRRNYLVGVQGGSRSLTPMPDGMRMMVPTRWLPILESPLFSWQARLAYLREPKRAAELKAAAGERPEDFDESVRTFVTRHFGEEATETIAGPLLAGVFGGDIETLSAGAVLAPFVRLEKEHGSLIAPTMERIERDKAEGKPTPPVFTTLRSGLSTLVERMAATLPENAIRKNTPVRSIEKTVEGWTVHSEPHGAQPQTEHFDAVILATPAHVTRGLLQPVHAEAAALLQMEATSAIVVALCFDEPSSAKLRIPRGFGFLVPPKQALSAEPELLAGTFMHQKFPHRAPEGCVFLRGFFGGHAAPRMMDWEDDRIAEAARAQFSLLLGPLPAPAHAVVRRWPRSLPQYRVGHAARVRALHRHLESLPMLALTGNAYHGVGLPALVHDAQKTVRSLLARATE